MWFFQQKQWRRRRRQKNDRDRVLFFLSSILIRYHTIKFVWWIWSLSSATAHAIQKKKKKWKSIVPCLENSIIYIICVFSKQYRNHINHYSRFHINIHYQHKLVNICIECMQSKSREMIGVWANYTFHRYCIKCHIGSESIETDKSQRKQDSFTFTHCMDNENIIIILKKKYSNNGYRWDEKTVYTCMHTHTWWSRLWRRQNKTRLINVKIFHFHVWFIWFLSFSSYFFFSSPFVYALLVFFFYFAHFVYFVFHLGLFWEVFVPFFSISRVYIHCNSFPPSLFLVFSFVSLFSIYIDR